MRACTPARAGARLYALGVWLSRGSAALQDWEYHRGMDADELVSRFHELEQEMCDIRTQLRELDVDPYAYIPADEEENDVRSG